MLGLSIIFLFNLFYMYFQLNQVDRYSSVGRGLKMSQKMLTFIILYIMIMISIVVFTMMAILCWSYSTIPAAAASRPSKVQKDAIFAIVVAILIIVFFVVAILIIVFLSKCSLTNYQHLSYCFLTCFGGFGFDDYNISALKGSYYFWIYWNGI